MSLTDIGEIKSIMSRHGFNTSKALGQNFLINPTVCPRMAEAVCTESCGIIEIGPGIGVLTRELSKKAKKVIAIELDTRLIPILKETLWDCKNVTVINGDVMKADLKEIIAESFEGLDVAVCANLPYYITTPVIMRLLEERLPIKTIVVMVQKEAAQRLISPPGVRDCGAISSAVFNYCVPETLFPVSHGSFMPAPKVDSAVIKLSVLETPQITNNSELVFKIIKAAFSQRRKRAVNSISSLLGISKAQLESAFSEAEVSINERAEQITLDQWKKIAEKL
ncbi:MAG: 16S rRNA (adenine(1518)-N(6)/adenine(1519)-N(6))-dimethyltransferase RsmA [Oscillospiraceae bacterium]